VSDWLINASEQFSAIQRRDYGKLHFDDENVRFLLFQLAWWDFYSTSSLKKNSLWIDMSLQYETISRFRDNQSLFLLLLCAKYQKYSKHQFHILWFDQIPNRGSISWSTTHKASTTTTTTRIWIVSEFFHCNDLFLYNGFSGTSINIGYHIIM